MRHYSLLFRKYFISFFKKSRQGPNSVHYFNYHFGKEPQTRFSFPLTSGEMPLKKTGFFLYLHCLLLVISHTSSDVINVGPLVMCLTQERRSSGGGRRSSKVAAGGCTCTHMLHTCTSAHARTHTPGNFGGEI